jgi:hypothetical protein
MKLKTLFLAILLSSLAVISCAESSPSNLDKFIGEWTGEYIHKNKNRKDSWIQTRTADGTFKLVYEVYQYGVLSSTEINEGTWWLEGEYFYEKQNGKHDKADKYSFEFIGKDKIKFTEISTNEKTSELIEGYSFIDTRINK